MKSTQYSEKTLDHFRNPRNVGTLEGDDVAIGRVGNPVCGDLMEMYIKVADDRIADIRFQTFGCGSAVATSSMTTELVKGMTLDEALGVTRGNVADALDGLPPVKMHCSNLAADALHDAIKNWRSGKKLEPLTAEEVAGVGSGCAVPAATVVANADDYLGHGLFKHVDDINELAEKRTLVLDRGPASAKLALELTKVTPRVVFLTELDTLGLPEDLSGEIKRSDVKVLYQARLLSVLGEGEVEKVRIHDLDEDNQYELFVDAVVLLEA
ncbi:MAG: iron-sulfur cluster assembly scaffold protein [Actinobacteria bacterium HGW-Actinobacteria-1]|nr:MAG: iron-sulfur cluster assembly scaffold protein [Actinobacteria bacterium HGW-Actinobacteria-1]